MITLTSCVCPSSIKLESQTSDPLEVHPLRPRTVCTPSFPPLSAQTVWQGEEY